MPTEFFAFDDPDFERILTEVLNIDLAELVDQAQHNDRLLDALYDLDKQTATIAATVRERGREDQTARLMTLLIAFTLGYRVGRTTPA